MGLRCARAPKEIEVEELKNRKKGKMKPMPIHQLASVEQLDRDDQLMQNPSEIHGLHNGEIS